MWNAKGYRNTHLITAGNYKNNACISILELRKHEPSPMDSLAHPHMIHRNGSENIQHAVFLNEHALHAGLHIQGTDERSPSYSNQSACGEMNLKE
jgi:hypothetical protein